MDAPVLWSLGTASSPSCPPMTSSPTPEVGHAHQVSGPSLGHAIRPTPVALGDMQQPTFRNTSALLIGGFEHVWSPVGRSSARIPPADWPLLLQLAVTPPSTLEGGQRRLGHGGRALSAGLYRPFPHPGRSTSQPIVKLFCGY
ncbi:unnamed protein product [Lota lota]